MNEEEILEEIADAMSGPQAGPGLQSQSRMVARGDAHPQRSYIRQPTSNMGKC